MKKAIFLFLVIFLCFTGAVFSIEYENAISLNVALLGLGLSYERDISEFVDEFSIGFDTCLQWGLGGFIGHYSIFGRYYFWEGVTAGDGDGYAFLQFTLGRGFVGNWMTDKDTWGLHIMPGIGIRIDYWNGFILQWSGHLPIAIGQTFKIFQDEPYFGATMGFSMRASFGYAW